MVTNYEHIKQMTLDEMAECFICTFYTRDKEGNRRKYYIALDGKPYYLLADLIKANKRFLESEYSEELSEK